MYESGHPSIGHSVRSSSNSLGRPGSRLGDTASDGRGTRAGQGEQGDGGDASQAYEASMHRLQYAAHAMLEPLALLALLLAGAARLNMCAEAIPLAHSFRGFPSTFESIAHRLFAFTCRWGLLYVLAAGWLSFVVPYHRDQDGRNPRSWLAVRMLLAAAISLPPCTCSCGGPW